MPLATFEHRLHPWIAFVVLPIFAFANAGVSFAGVGLDALLAPLSPGIAAGLVVEKQLGILGACVLALKSGNADMAEGVSYLQHYGLSSFAGIGFTMSLFIGGLAIVDPAQMDGVKMGVITGSLISAMVGITVLVFARPVHVVTKELD